MNHHTNHKKSWNKLTKALSVWWILHWQKTFSASTDTNLLALTELELLTVSKTWLFLPQFYAIILCFSVFWTADHLLRWIDGATSRIQAPPQPPMSAVVTMTISRVTSTSMTWVTSPRGWPGDRCPRASLQTTHAASAWRSGPGPRSLPASTVSSTSEPSSGKLSPIRDSEFRTYSPFILLYKELYFPECRYLSTSSLDIGGIRDGDIISSLDISVFSICVVMVLVSILLLASAIRQVPCQTLPWLCANTVAMIMAMVSPF